MNTQSQQNEAIQTKFSTTKLSKEIYEQIEKRNNEILKFIIEMKYVTAKQIESAFFSFAKEKSKTYLDSCLKKLTSSKFIEKRNYEKHEIYIATDVAYKYLCEKAEGKVIASLNKRVFEPRLNHDLKLVDLRISLEQKKSLRKWYSENMLKEIPWLRQNFVDLPDGLLAFQDGSSVFTELEISRKANQRYMERINEYKKVLLNEEMKRQKICKVMFICTDVKVFDYLKEILALEKQFEVKMINEFGL